MVAEEKRVKLKGEQMRVDVGAKVALLDRDARRAGQRLRPQALGIDERIARGARLVVELGRRRGEETPAGKRLMIGPIDPAGEQGTEPRLSAIGPKRGSEDALAKLCHRELEDVELQSFLGAEVGEEPALR